MPGDTSLKKKKKILIIKGNIGIYIFSFILSHKAKFKINAPRLLELLAFFFFFSSNLISCLAEDSSGLCLPEVECVVTMVVFKPPVFPFI